MDFDNKLKFLLMTLWRKELVNVRRTRRNLIPSFIFLFVFYSEYPATIMYGQGEAHVFLDP